MQNRLNGAEVNQVYIDKKNKVFHDWNDINLKSSIVHVIFQKKIVSKHQVQITSNRPIFGNGKKLESKTQTNSN